MRRIITSSTASTTSHLWRSDIFSVRAAVVRTLIRNLREGTTSTDHERYIPRWVERTGVLEITRTHCPIRPAFNLGCGFSQNKVELMVLRFMAGLGGGAPLAVRVLSSNP